MARELSEEDQSQLETELDTFAIGEKEVKERYTFADDTIKEYERIGIIAIPRPKMVQAHETIFPDLKTGSYYDGRMPLTMKQLTLDEVSMLLSLTNNWYGYLAGQYAIVAAQRSEAKRKRDAVWSIVRNAYRKIFKHWGQSVSDQKCSDFARQDSRFVEVEDAYERLNVLYEALYTLTEHTKKELDVVSREVTIRQTKMESEARYRGISHRVDTQRAKIPIEERRRVNDSASSNTPRKVVAKIRTR
jgi:hypothetical protein